MARTLKTYEVREISKGGQWFTITYLHLWTPFTSGLWLPEDQEALVEILKTFKGLLENKTPGFSQPIEIHMFQCGHFKISPAGQDLRWGPDRDPETGLMGICYLNLLGDIQDVTDQLLELPDSEIIKRSKTKDLESKSSL